MNVSTLSAGNDAVVQNLLPAPTAQDGSTRRGYQKVRTSALEMTGLLNLIVRYSDRKPLEETPFLGCVIITAETAVFMFTLRRLGAELSWCSDNRFASDPDVIAYLRHNGFRVFAEPNMSLELYYKNMQRAYQVFGGRSGVQIHDDGCDITRYLADQAPPFLEKVRVISEQTTCGITFLKHLYRDRKLPCPAISVAGAYLKKFDNFFGVQQAIAHSLTNTGISIASKKIAVVGFGHVGSGAARELRGLGAAVGVVEQDIAKLARACFKAFTPLSIEEALSQCDIILSATGCLMTISGDMIEKHARDGLVLGNIGHGQEEIDIEWLEQHGTREDINPLRAAFTLPDKRTVHCLCEGALVNFVAGHGNPPVELSLTFTAAALVHIESAKEGRNGQPMGQPGIHPVSVKAETECGVLNFPGLLPKLYRLSDEQKRYLCLDAED